MNHPVSVLIITLDEERNLPRCLESLKWCDDVVVFDSFSHDRTEEIVRSSGARFFQRVFDDYASQRNAALNEVDFKHPWVLMIDADEYVTEELAEEISKNISSSEENAVLFRIRRKDMFLGTWIKQSSGYPTWFARLMRPSKVEFRREVHEDCFGKGKEGYLREHFVHYPFGRGFGAWFDRHNSYSSVEAKIRVCELQEPISIKNLFSANPSLRRSSLKKLAYRLPLRPLLVFVYLYIWRMGVKEGRAGLMYSCFRAIYEYMIDLKLKELRRRQRGYPI